MQLDTWYKIHMSTSKCQYLGINCSLWHRGAQMKCAETKEQPDSVSATNAEEKGQVVQ